MMKIINGEELKTNKQIIDCAIQFVDEYSFRPAEERNTLIDGLEEIKDKLVWQQELTDHIDKVLVETESMTSISAEQRLRNEMRYIKEKLEELE